MTVNWSRHLMRFSSNGSRAAVAAVGALAVLFVITAPVAHATPAVENGFTYEVTDGLATITEFDPDAPDAPSMGNLVIPSTLGGGSVSQIADSVFIGKGLSGSLTLPNSVVSVGASSFASNSGITSVSFGASQSSSTLSTIGDRAFAGTNITGSLAMPNSLRSIGMYAFAGNGAVTSVSFGSSQSDSTLNSIGEGAFARVGLTGTLALPNSLTAIGDTAFALLTRVTTVAFGTSQTASSLTTIGNSTFNGMDLTGALLLPNSLINLGPGAFGNNPRLTSVAFGASQSAALLTSIGQAAFASTGLTGPLHLPDSLTTLGTSAFDALPNLTSISFESAPGQSHLESIGDTAFYGDSGLSGVLSMPDSVTSIGSSAFMRAGAMTLRLGTSISASHLTSIGLGAFGFSGINTSLEIPNAVTTIGDGAFFYFDNLTRLGFGSGLSTISANVFATSPLTSITFAGNAPTSVGVAAFASSSTSTFTRWQGSTGWGSTYAADGQSFNVAIAAPTVTSVSPVSGSILGNQPITITGTGFAPGASVNIGMPATNVSVVNSRTITARTPAAAGAGAVGITVSNVVVDAPLGTGEPLSGSLNSAYTYLGPGPLTFSSGVFPTVTLGSRSNLTVTVTNTGGDSLTPSAITVAGAGVSTAGGTCAVSGYIGGHDTCTLNLSWAPSEVGDLASASLVIAYPNGDVPSNELPLTGIATAPSSGGGSAVVEAPVAQMQMSLSARPVPTELKPGTGSLLINGVVTPVLVEKSADGKDVIISGGGVRLVLSATGVNGQPLPLGPDGSLIVSSAGGIPMAGTGFAAGSTVTLFMFSTPVTLGTATANAEGAYATSALIPGATTTGSHTIQVVGTTTSGQPIALSLGVTVTLPKAPLVMSVRVIGARSHHTDQRMTVQAIGVQAGCTVKFWIKGSTVVARAGMTGIASAKLVSPPTPGVWTITARASGSKCEQASAQTRHRVSSR